MTPQQINTLRERFFKECTEWKYFNFQSDARERKVNMTPHNLFEWFISQPEEERGDYVASSNNTNGEAINQGGDAGIKNNSSSIKEGE